MESRTHWIFEHFSPDAEAMRKKIDEHFDESIARKLGLAKRGIWNYWYINKNYTYLRTLPANVFPGLDERFMAQLKAFVAQQYGMVIQTIPYLSMYVNGCGQNIHNDTGNGRLAYVYSLTNWQEKRFEGGETVIYRLEYDRLAASRFSGLAFSELVAPEFNRLVIFDDRVPHAVRPIQGTMDPVDARFVIHGHIHSPQHIPYVKGGLEGSDLAMQWQGISTSAADIFERCGYHGFATFTLDIGQGGDLLNASVSRMQLWPLSNGADGIAACLDEAVNAMAKIAWPKSGGASTLVVALSSR